MVGKWGIKAEISFMTLSDIVRQMFLLSSPERLPIGHIMEIPKKKSRGITFSSGYDFFFVFNNYLSWIQLPSATTGE
jgi:hypothetical protein